MWLIILLFIVGGAFFAFELWRFIAEAKRRKRKKLDAQAVNDKGKEDN